MNNESPGLQLVFQRLRRSFSKYCTDFFFWVNTHAGFTNKDRVTFLATQKKGGKTII